MHTLPLMSSNPPPFTIKIVRADNSRNAMAFMVLSKFGISKEGQNKIYLYMNLQTFMLLFQ